MGWDGHPARKAVGFTLIETLVVVSIIALLLSILLPALSSVRSRMKMLKCSSNMRTVALKFYLFAEGESVEGRGDSDIRGRRSFFINDFQESLYKIDEFWDEPGTLASELIAASEPMLCPAGPAVLTKKSGFPCSNRSLGPAEDVTLAANMRLQRAEIGQPDSLILASSSKTYVPQNILSHPYVPLVFDVDGGKAAERKIQPFYSAPAVRGSIGPYSSGQYWMPSSRHGGQTNVAFVGGHVLSSRDPGHESWDWTFQGGIDN